MRRHCRVERSIHIRAGLAAYRFVVAIPACWGAAILAGRAALRSGAGLVTLITQRRNLDLIALAQPELMSRCFEQTVDLDMAADAVVLGPGTGTGDWSRKLFHSALGLACPRVIDAGALRLLAQTDSVQEHQVLTPHPGEAAALLASDTSSIQRDRIAAAKRIARRYGGVCILKGSGTVITDGEQVRICEHGNPGMASAGMGDVLSGIVGAFLAQGLSPIDAADAGVYLHAVAADMTVKSFNEYSLIASDVVDGLDNVIKTCLR